MSAVLATASPRRIKASHRRRRKVTAGPIVQRYYDPGIGRFLSTDPAVSTFNLYAYANNNPYKFIDPDGRVATLGTVTVTGSRPPSEYDYYSPEAKARRNQEGRDILKWFGGPFAAAGSHIVDGEYWSAGFEAAGILPFFRLTKGVEVFEAAKDLNKATKSTMALGQKMHKLYKADVADGIARIKEFRLPSGKRIDYIDIEKGVIYELKPNNARSIREGLKQLQGYLDEVKSMPQFQGIQWKTVLETY